MEIELTNEQRKQLEPLFEALAASKLGTTILAQIVEWTDDTCTVRAVLITPQAARAIAAIAHHPESVCWR
jgi:hypothetical protein